jgi:WD40 repeat protein
MAKFPFSVRESIAFYYNKYYIETIVDRFDGGHIGVCMYDEQKIILSGDNLSMIDLDTKSITILDTDIVNSLFEFPMPSQRVVLSKSKNIVVYIYKCYNIKIINMNTRQITYLVTEDDYSAADIAISPDEKTIAVSTNKKIDLYCAQSGQIINTINTSMCGWNIIFSPNCKNIIVSDGYRPAMVINIETNKCKVLDITGWCVPVLFSHSEKLIAFNQKNKTINILDPNSMECINIKSMGDKYCRAHILSGENTNIIVLCWQYNIDVIDIDSNKCIKKIFLTPEQYPIGLIVKNNNIKIILLECEPSFTRIKVLHI